MLDLLARLPTGRRSKWAVLAVALLVAAGLASQAGRFTEITSSEPGDQLPQDAESARVAQLQAEAGDQTLPAVVVLRRPGGLTEQDRAALGRLAQGLREDPVALQEAVTPPEFSQDGSGATLTVILRRSDDGDVLVGAVDDLRARADSLPDDGLQRAVTGPGAFAADIATVFEDADQTLLLVSGTLVLVLLILIYRSPVFWAIPFAIVLLAEFSSRGTAVWLAELGLTVTGQASGILIVLVFGAATDSSLLIVSRYREELREHEDTHAAMREALRRSSPAILASGGTVIAGLLTLLLANVAGTQSIGPLGAAGVALALLFVLTALPAALLVIGRRAFWPQIPREGDEDETGSGFWGRVADFIPRRPRATWIGAAIVLAVLSLGLLRLDTNLSRQDWFTEDVGAITGQQLLAEAFPAGSSAPATVYVPDAADAAAVRAALRDSDEITAVSPPRPRGDAAVLQATLRGDPFAADTVSRIPDVREAAEQGSSDALVGGPTAEEHDLREASQRDTLVVPPAALAVVFVILIILLRALAAPLLIMATVVASNLAAVGLGVLVSSWIFGFPALDPTVPLLAFVFLVALGIDYNIYLTTRAREEAEREGARRGMLRALAVTGGVITAAGIVLAGTFTTLAVLPLVILTQLGVTVAMGVLLDSLVVRTILTPALGYDLGAPFWWPARVRD